ncbi:hypothetical protein SAMN02910447_02782 [Ruminococcus sp. YE71]|uniref:hypothetical protein n=1 Tax=unclassified Ruminococcus TaxID=2608920 RepID=UPI0008813D7D|nr:MULTISPECIES: hypothetical protein [unclassified Ruminococcus]SDA27281.1 hypothetical protein SAMN02910446_02770 [Ruminococcus sp. YE78]SFW45280.1 hypothetical protein SAMN02910447_02782 [Ruminococcus sp. YE71]
MARDNICSFCGSGIGIGDYCCPSCGAVPPERGMNTETERRQRLKKNMGMNAAAAAGTLLVLGGAAAALIPMLTKVDLGTLKEKSHVYSEDDTSSRPSFSIDTDSMVHEGMQSWRDEYGSLFANSISVPDFDPNEYFDEASDLDYYKNVRCEHHADSGIISNEYFSISADTKLWSVEGESSADEITVKNGGKKLTVSCFYNSGDESHRCGSIYAANHFYKIFSMTLSGCTIYEPEEVRIGKYSGHLVSYTDDAEDKTTGIVFVSVDDVLVRFDIEGYPEDYFDMLHTLEIEKTSAESGGSLEGVNLHNYTVPTEYDSVNRIICDYASIWVDPDKWTIVNEPDQDQDCSFIFKGEEDAAFFAVYSHSSLIGKYTPLELAGYYSKNLGAKEKYTLEFVGEDKLGKYDSGDLHMTVNEDDGSVYQLKMKIVKQGDFAAMFYWMLPEKGYPDAYDSITEMLGTFKINEDTV